MSTSRTESVGSSPNQTRSYEQDSEIGNDQRAGPLSQFDVLHLTDDLSVFEQAKIRELAQLPADHRCQLITHGFE